MKKLLLLFSIATPLLCAMLCGSAAMSAWIAYSMTGYVDVNLVAMACIGLTGAVVFQFGSLQPKRSRSRPTPSP